MLNQMAYLQTDGQVNPGAKCCADSSRRQPHILKQLGEGLCEGEARALFCYRHTAPHTRQVHSTGLKQLNPFRNVPLMSFNDGIQIRIFTHAGFTYFSLLFLCCFVLLIHSELSNYEMLLRFLLMSYLIF